MDIQSLSICVPAKRCMNDCLFCCSKMHEEEYKNLYETTESFHIYADCMKKRMIYARENNCHTCILTGTNEPQQNYNYLQTFGEVNRNIPSPFQNIEMQTTGSFIGEEMLSFLQYSVGVTTMALSVSCLDSDKMNRNIIQTKDKLLSLKTLCTQIKNKNMNLRLCLNMNDHILVYHTPEAKNIVDICKGLGADQITFRALWSSDDGSEQSKWVKENVTDKTKDLIDELKADIKANGRYLDSLKYGLERYDYHGLSVVIDEDCMAKSEDAKAIKYFILRPDGHLYTKWDSKASLVF